MTPKFLSRSSKYLQWLLPGGLLLVLALGFLQIPEVKTRLDPDFLWTDQLYRLQKEERKVKLKLNRAVVVLNSLRKGERPGERDLVLIKKDLISVTNSLKFMDAMLANLRGQLQAGLPQTAPARRAYLQQVKTMQLGCEEYHFRLQEVSQKMQGF